MMKPHSSPHHPITLSPDKLRRQPDHLLLHESQVQFLPTILSLHCIVKVQHQALCRFHEYFNLLLQPCQPAAPCSRGEGGPGGRRGSTTCREPLIPLGEPLTPLREPLTVLGEPLTPLRGSLICREPLTPQGELTPGRGREGSLGVLRAVSSLPLLHPARGEGGGREGRRQIRPYSLVSIGGPRLAGGSQTSRPKTSH